MFYQIFLSPQVKRWAIITYKHCIYELSHKLPNEIRSDGEVNPGLGPKSAFTGPQSAFTSPDIKPGSISPGPKPASTDPGHQSALTGPDPQSAPTPNPNPPTQPGLSPHIPTMPPQSPFTGPGPRFVHTQAGKLIYPQ